MRSTSRTQIAALFIDERGPYVGLPNVDAWGKTRDARLYRGPWPVVAHPPCERWGAMLLEDRRQRSAEPKATMAVASLRPWLQSENMAAFLNTRHIPEHGRRSAYSSPMRSGGRLTFLVDGLAKSGRDTTVIAPPRLRGFTLLAFWICRLFAGVLVSECGWTKGSIAPKNARARALQESRRSRGLRRKRTDVLQFRFEICSFRSQSTRGRLESV